MFTVIDSSFRGSGVGFEYGYAAAEPNTLTIWEAQFGDFVNGAQVVIDQFIASGEVKWGRSNGLVMMLPHGCRGPGARAQLGPRGALHAAGRADNNMQIVQPTNAAQIFHVLRRQMLRMFRKPLVIMTPKSLLRAKDATSPLSDFTKGGVPTVIGEQNADIVADKVKRVVVCSGKVYYDLVRKREERSPPTWPSCASSSSTLPAQGLRGRDQEVSERHRHRLDSGRARRTRARGSSSSTRSRNMLDGQKLGYAGRPASASPACGYAHLHQDQQRRCSTRRSPSSRVSSSPSELRRPFQP